MFVSTAENVRCLVVGEGDPDMGDIDLSVLEDCLSQFFAENRNVLHVAFLSVRQPHFSLDQRIVSSTNVPDLELRLSSGRV